MSEVATDSTNLVGGISVTYPTYRHQQCFVGHSSQAEWCDDILSACATVLPSYGLEPWYAADHFDPTKPLRDKIVELIANSHYGIYDLSYWQDRRSGEWHIPRNVFIEFGMAIALNRPTLLLLHTSNRERTLPSCLQGVELVEFAGDTTLKRALEERLPQWVEGVPEKDWTNRFCIFGNQVCSYRERHPKDHQWAETVLHCHVLDGYDRSHPSFPQMECEETRGAIGDVLGHYDGIDMEFGDALPAAKGYQFALCSYCQVVRSTPFAIYRILENSSAELFIAVGISIALETIFGYPIPRILIVRSEEELPTLLQGYEVISAPSSSDIKRKMRSCVPRAIRQARETVWKPRILPFEEHRLVLRRAKRSRNRLPLATSRQTKLLCSTQLSLFSRPKPNSSQGLLWMPAQLTRLSVGILAGPAHRK